jgi:hypothetical protein
MFRTRLGLLAAVLVSAQSASAALITYSADFSVGGFVCCDSEGGPVQYTGETSFNSSQTVGAALQRFDATLGTLTGVEISLASAHRRTVQLQAVDDDFNFDFPPYDASAEFSLVEVLQVRRTDPSSLTRTFFDSLNGSCSDGSFFDVADCSVFGHTGVAGDFNEPLLTSGLATGPLSSYIGVDPLDFTFTMTDTLILDCDSDDDGDRCYLLSTVGNWFGSITASYTYTPYTPPGGGDGGGGTTPVDEPGVFSLLGLGLAGLALRMRRSARHARSA